MTARVRSVTSSAGLRRSALVRRLRDPAEVRTRLQEISAFAAYAIAYIDRQHFSLADFFEATSGERRALLMHARGGLGPSSVALGDPALVAALVRLHPGPRQTFLTCEPEHVERFLVGYDVWRPQTMLRMRLDRASFRHEPLPSNVRRLVDADAGDLNTLYAIEEDGLRYSGRQVSEGIYYGGFNRGRLVSAAGTHIHSHSEGVGVIGNVFTHPDHRGHGLGTAVTAAVAGHLLRTCDLVVLNVDPANRTARHIYETLGFKEAGRLVEAMATRRDALSPLPLLRRTLARWRAAEPATEAVDL
jgi:ribosomal protein S18 acetylase RimI-like enzyme